MPNKPTTLRELLIKADSLLSFLHYRGYINYSKQGCPSEQEVIDVFAKLRTAYTSHNTEQLREELTIKEVLNYLVRIGVLQSWTQESDRTFQVTFN